MYYNKKFTAIIPARAGSKGIKKKNIKKLDGHPLIAYSIEAAKQSKYIDEIYVSTDGKEISKIAKKYGSEVILRPKVFSDDVSNADLAVSHAINFIINKLHRKVDNIVFMQPTSPLRCKNDLDKSIEKFLKDKSDSLFSGVSLHPCLWNSKNMNYLKPVNYNPFRRKRRQSDKNNIVENGSIYVSKKQTYLKYKNIFGNKISSYIMNYICLSQIDDLEEFKVIESIIKSKNFEYLKFIKPK